MHYCCLVITKEFPTDEILEKVLAPFNEYTLEEEPNQTAFGWDWYSVGGRYGGRIKLKVAENDEKYRWGCFEREPRNGRLFRSALLDELGRGKSSSDRAYSELYVFKYMGFRDGIVLVDAALSDDIQNLSEMECYCFIDQYGNAFACEYYTGAEWVENNEFYAQLANAKENSSGCYICVVDLHD